MRKTGGFALAVLAFCVGAAELRWWQRTAAFEPLSGLLTPGNPATWCLVALVALAAAAFALLGRWVLKKAEFRGYLAAFSLPRRGLMCLYLLAGAMLVAAGFLGVRARQMGLDSQLSRYVFSIALIPTGVDLALIGWLGAQKNEGQGRFAWPLLLPGYCACLWLISAYQRHTAEPNTMAYGLYFLGGVCAAAACYYIAAFSFDRPRPGPCLWLCAMSLTLLSTAAVDGYLTGERGQTLVCLGYMLYLACQMMSLLYRLRVPAQLERWEPPAAERDEDETEVTDHE